MVKKNSTNQKYIEIGLYKAAGIVATAVLGSAVGTAFGIIATANSDHFTIISNTSRIEAVESVIVPRVEVETGFGHISTRLDRIENKLDRVIENK